MTLGEASQHEVSSGWNSYLFLERCGDQCLEKVICHPSCGSSSPSSLPHHRLNSSGHLCKERCPVPQFPFQGMWADWEATLGLFVVVFSPNGQKKFHFAVTHTIPVCFFVQSSVMWLGQPDSSHRHNPFRFHLYFFQNASPENEFQKGETLNHFLLLKIKIKVI